MPDGVVIDSRASYNPRWGFLIVDQGCGSCDTTMDQEINRLYEEEKLDDNQRISLKNYQELPPQGTLLLFVSNYEVNKGDRVCFKLIGQNAENIPFWMAEVTKVLEP